jgi:uncharacterized membrane protein YphA (DoxX/SURF4 family)
VGFSWKNGCGSVEIHTGNPDKSAVWKARVVFFLRVISGLIFVIAGLSKYFSQDTLTSYTFIPAPLISILDHTLPGLEIGLGLILITGLFQAFSAGTTILLSSSFILFNIFSLLYSNTAICPCFGGLSHINHYQALAIDVIMLLSGIILLRFKIKKYPYSISSFLSKRQACAVLSNMLILFLVAATFTISLPKAVQSDSPPDSQRHYPLMKFSGEQLKDNEEEYKGAPAYQTSLQRYEDRNTPASYSLLPDLQYVPAERDQGNPGNCWVWAGTGCVEIDMAAQTGLRDRLSIQYFDSKYKNGILKWAGCGGLATEFSDFYNSTHTLVPWSNTNAQYQDASRTCSSKGTEGTLVPASSIQTNPNYQITSITAHTISTAGISQAGAIENIKSTLLENKAVYLEMSIPTTSEWNVFNSFWENSAETDIWEPGDACGGYWDLGGGGAHAVLLVGYNDDDPDNRYWLVLNSWGTPDKRPNGLFRIAQDINYNCSYEYTLFNVQALKFWAFDIEYGFDFTISSSASSGTLVKGNMADLAVVTATLSSGVTQPVNLSLSGLPGEVGSAVFSPSTVSPSASPAGSPAGSPAFTSIFSINTESNAPAGTYNNLTITATGGGVSKTLPFTLSIVNELIIFDQSLAKGEIKVPYSQTLAAPISVAPYKWSILKIKGESMPPGLKLNAAKGIISGKPTKSGEFVFTVQVSDSATPPASATRQFTMTIHPAITISKTSPAEAEIGVTFPTWNLTAKGGSGLYTWSISRGSLPEGLILNQTSGEISGTPRSDLAAVHSYSLTIQATDSLEGWGNKNFTLKVYPSVFITTLSLPNDDIAVKYRQTLKAAGGKKKYTWSVISGSLPDGLTLDTAKGIISGIPVEGTSRIWDFTVQADDGIGSAVKELSITVNEPLKISVDPEFTPGCTVGDKCNYVLTAGGGSGSGYKWSISGKRPTGLTLNSKTGIISGTLQKAGDYKFMIKLTDSLKGTTTRELIFNVS